MVSRSISLLLLFGFVAITSACGNEHELLAFGNERAENAPPPNDPPWPQLRTDGGDEPDGGTDREDDPTEVDVTGEDEAATDDGDAGCTLTQGYWKNHEEAWPVASLTLGAVSYTAAQLDALLGTPTTGDASLILVHQMIAALLNVANGADVPLDVDAALASAQQWMQSRADSDGRLPYGTQSGSESHTQATSIAGTLADFNEGSIGPGHCR